MSRAFTIILAAAILTGVLSLQSIPIPSRPDGFSLGNLNATFQFEAFYDLMCSDCQNSYNQLKPLLPRLFNNSNFRLTLHFFPLPYHHNAIHLTQAAKFIEQNLPANDTFYFVGQCLNVIQQQLYNVQTVNLTLPQIKGRIANLTSQAFSGRVNASAVYNALYNTTYEQAAILSWKYGAERNVAGTPTYLANNIRVDDAGDFLTADWVDFFKQYLPGF